MQLKSGTLLKGGEYKIEKVLGQGGFGITYLGEQVSLKRKVAIKEFFMKEYCERSVDTSAVSMGTSGSKELVGKFREKFVKEAQNIAGLNHGNIIKVHDVFEENNTAYYVMEYLDCGSLSDYVAGKGRLSEAESEVFIKQIASALSYIHERKINHLDVKPGNILLDENNNAVLIDFGLSKHYTEDGGQTSSTPVGISRGYAPMEQYKQGGVSKFSPESDIYSLGATLYKMVTGSTPPEADDVNENGLSFPSELVLSERIKQSITFAMQPKRKDRPQSVGEFLAVLESKTPPKEDTYVEVKVKVDPVPEPGPTPTPVPDPNPRGKWIILLILSVILGFGGYYAYEVIEGKKYEAMLIDKHEYLSLIGAGDKLLSEKKYSESINKYEQAQVYEDKYKGSEYTSEFDKDASAKKRAAEETERRYKEREAAAKAEAERLEKEKQEREAAAKAEAERLEKEKKEREAAVKAEAVRLEKERQQPGTAEYNRTHGSINGHDWVDLGLSVKWATSNVGAESPEDYGNYYAWGETSTKSEYTKDNSKTYGKQMNDIGGMSQYDAARANWGGSWRLPTKAECRELVDKCKWTWTTQGGNDGYKVAGPNGNSIFLPAAGLRINSSLISDGGNVYYWSSKPYEGDSDCAYRLDESYSGDQRVSKNYRYFGLSVRPVSE